MREEEGRLSCLDKCEREGEREEQGGRGKREWRERGNGEDICYNSEEREKERVREETEGDVLVYVRVYMCLYIAINTFSIRRLLITFYNSFTETPHDHRHWM